MKDSNKFPWRTMMFWSSVEKPLLHSKRDSEFFIDSTGVPFDREEWRVRAAAEAAAVKAAKAQDPLQGQPHSFAAILTFLGGEKVKTEIIGSFKHDPITWSKIEIDPLFFRFQLNTPPEVRRFFTKICDTFPDMCKQLRECPLVVTPKR